MTSTRIGCSGWNYDAWRGRLYPPGVPKRRWLEVYAEHFDTVEVNTTFYRLPKRAAVAAWAEQTPDGFEFTVKASRYLTHIKRLTDVGEGVRRFYERIEPLGEAGTLGPVLWQPPANFHRDDARLEGWLAARPPGRYYGSRGRGGNYSVSELATWARRIAQWRRRQDVYAYFNNDWNGYAPANAAALIKRLTSG
jgi:uncharacterized protein YecE (DUF72 family)